MTLAVALLALPPVHAGEPVTLTVVAQGFVGTSGTALFALYDTDQAWLDLDQAAFVVRAPIDGPTVQAALVGVPRGTWGVSVIHDANRNDTLDMRWLPWPKPTEGAGTSNDPTSLLGPPSFDAAAIQITGDQAVRLTLQY